MKIVMKKKQYGIVSIVFCAYLINIFYFKNIISIHRLLTWGIVLLSIAINYKVVLELLRRSKKYLDFILIPVILWLGFIIVSPLIHGTGDFSYFNMLLTMTGTVLNYLVVLIIAYKHKGSRDLTESFMYLYMYSIVLYVLFSILCITIPQVRTFIVSYVDISSENMRLLNLSKYATRIGWAGFSGYSCGLKCAIASIFALHFIVTNHIKMNKQRFDTIIIYIFSLIGVFFYSRTGLIAITFILLITVIYDLKRRSLLSTIWFVVFSTAIVLFLPVLELIALNNSSLAWLMEPLMNIMSDDGFSTTTTTHIFNDMLFKLNGNQLLFGDGLYTGPNGYYMKTDLGFMRLILYFGIPGMIATYSIVIASIIFLFKNYLVSDIKYFTFYWIILFTLFEFKGESIQIIIPMLLVMCISIMASSQNKVIIMKQEIMA